LFVFRNSFSQIRTSQIYTGGGNTGATYKQDFAEIFNGNTEAATLTDWATQYAPATGPGGNGGRAWHNNFIPGSDSCNESWNTVIPYNKARGARLVQAFDFLSGNVPGCAARGISIV